MFQVRSRPPWPALAVVLLVASASRPQEPRAQSRAASGAAEVRVEVATRVVYPDPAKPLPMKPQTRPFPACEGKPAWLEKEPDIRVSRYLATAVGGRRVALLVADDAERESATLVPDLDFDGTFDLEKEATRITFARKVGRLIYVADIRWRLPEAETRVTLMRRLSDGRHEGTLTFGGHREGTLVLGDETLSVVLIDAGVDGIPANAGDVWVVGPAAAIWDARRGPLGPGRMFPVEERAWLPDGRTARITGITADGRLTLVIGPPVEMLADALRRRGQALRAQALAAGDDAFRTWLQQSNTPPDRRKVATPPAWTWVTDAATVRARALMSSRPILVLFESLDSSACRFAERYLLEDEAVAQRLSRFVLLRWNVDFDAEGFAARFGEVSIPKLVVLDRSGEKELVTVLCQNPDAMVLELERALTRAGLRD